MTGGQDDAQDSSSVYKQGEILLTFDNATNSHRIAMQSARALSTEVESALGADSVEVIADASESSGSVAKVDLADDMPVEAAIAKASELDGVVHAQPNFIYHLLENGTPAEPGNDQGDGSEDGNSDVGDAGQTSGAAIYDDPYMADQYYLDGWDDGKKYADGAQDRGANVKKAWDTAIANRTVSIAILDTGIRVDHEDLQENIDKKNMWDAFTYPDPKNGRGQMTSSYNSSGDKNGHGTHVAGIAAGAAGNGKGIAGASGNANIIPIKVFNNESYQPGADTATIVEAYRYLLDLVETGEVNDLHVINMSLGSYRSETGWDNTDEALRMKISEARNEGILTVCAGGNGDASGNARTDAMYPSDYDEVLSVTALNPDGTNVQWSDYNEHKDISAPGVDIFSCYNQSSQSYYTMDGTSMASPLVAGIASLLWAAKPSLKVDDAVTAIEQTAQDLDTNGSNYHGDADDPDGSDTGSHGAINAAAAVTKVADGSVVNYKRMVDCTIEPIDLQLMENGAEHIEPAITVTASDGTVLEVDKDYKVRYSANDKVGTATVIAIGQGDYIGSVRTSFDIKYDFAKATGLGLVLSKSQFDAGDEEHKPTVMAAHNRSDKMSTYILNEGTDFTVAYPDDTKSNGEKTVTVTGMGDYSGARQLKYIVGTSTPGGSSSGGTGGGTVSGGGSVAPVPAPAPVKKSVKEECSIADIADQVYTGFAITPSPTVIAGRKTLVAGKDYTVSYAYNVDAGVATALITGMGDYSGVLAKRFKILPATITKADVAPVAREVYTGKGLKPQAKVSIGGKVLVEGEDYTLSYRDNVNVGRGTLVVNGMGNYKDSVEASFIIDKGVQKLFVRTKNAVLKASALRSKALGVKCLSKVTGARGKVTYKKTSGAGFMSINKKTGKIKVKKGARPGVYMAQVAVKAAATSNYASATKTAFVTVVVR